MGRPETGHPYCDQQGDRRLAMDLGVLVPPLRHRLAVVYGVACNSTPTWCRARMYVLCSLRESVTYNWVVHRFWGCVNKIRATSQFGVVAIYCKRFVFERLQFQHAKEDEMEHSESILPG